MGLILRGGLWIAGIYGVGVAAEKSSDAAKWLAIGGAVYLAYSVHKSGLIAK